MSKLKYALLLLIFVSIQAVADDQPAPAPAPKQMDLATRLGLTDDDPIYGAANRHPDNDASKVDIQPLTSPDGN